MRHMWRSNEGGFTVVELAMVMVIIAMVVGVFSHMLISANQSASISKAKVEISRNMHNSMDAIETDVRQASRFKVSSRDGEDTFATDKNFAGSTPREWGYRSNPYSSSAITDPEKNSLILLQYATNMGRGADSREIVYLRTPKFDCNANKTQQPKYKKIVIYFLKNGELHRRTIYNDLVDFSSYPPVPYSGSAAGYFCMNGPDADKFKDRAMKLREDSILATGVSEFKINYYDGKTLISKNSDAPDSDKKALDGADNVEVTLTIQSPSKQVSDSQTLMIRKINNL